MFAESIAFKTTHDFESADLFQSVERVGLQPAIPAYPAKPAKAGQAGQPARPAGHRSLRPPRIDVSNSSIGVPARALGVPQAGSLLDLQASMSATFFLSGLQPAP